MTRDLFRKALRDERAAFIGWGIAVVAYGAFTISLYPSIQGVETFEDYLEQLPPAFKVFLGDITDISTLEGFLTIEYLAYLPVLLSIYAIISGTRSLVGEEEAGTMDLVMSYPVTRAQVVAAKMLALLSSLFGICLLAGVTLAAMGPLVVDDAPVAGLFWAGLHAFPAAALVAVASITASAVVHRRKTAAVAVTVYVVASFVLNGFSKLVDWLEGAKYLTLFHYYELGEPIKLDLDPLFYLAMTLASLSLALGALYAFEHKDLAV